VSHILAVMIKHMCFICWGTKLITVNIARRCAQLPVWSHTRKRKFSVWR